MVTNFPFFKYNFVDYLEKTLVRPAIEIFIFHDEVWNNLQSLSATPDFKVHWVLHPFFPLLYFLMSDKSFCNLIRISFVQNRDVYTLRKKKKLNCYFNVFCFIEFHFFIFSFGFNQSVQRHVLMDTVKHLELCIATARKGRTTGG